MKKGIALGIVFLFLSMAITSTFGMSNNDDTTPPVSTHTLDPFKPDGENGWYVSDVNVTLTAIDCMSGVKEILYIVNDGPIQTFTGDNGTFILDMDGENHFIEYWAIDNAGNEETPHHTFTIDLDKTHPDINLYYEYMGGNKKIGWEIRFYVDATDDTSGMDHVEFYINDELKETVYGDGPYYYWQCYFRNTGEFNVKGLICNPKITDEYVKFYALIVIVKAIANWEEPYDACAYAYDKAGNWDYDVILNPCSQETITNGIHLFESLTLPNNYTGYIGKFFINADFYIL